MKTFLFFKGKYYVSLSHYCLIWTNAGLSAAIYIYLSSICMYLSRARTTVVNCHLLYLWCSFIIKPFFFHCLTFWHVGSFHNLLSLIEGVFPFKGRSLNYNCLNAHWQSYPTSKLYNVKNFRAKSYAITSITRFIVKEVFLNVDFCFSILGISTWVLLVKGTQSFFSNRLTD